MHLVMHKSSVATTLCKKCKFCENMNSAKDSCQIVAKAVESSEV